MIYPGLEIEGYIVEDEIGSGGYGRIYLVHAVSDQDKKYALKLLKPEFTRRPEYKNRFLNEIISMARLSMHPSIATVYGHLSFEDRDGEHLGMIMEYVQGESLDRFVYNHGKLVASHAVPLFLQVLDGIAAAHEQSIIHRDLKPANIMVLTAD